MLAESNLAEIAVRTVNHPWADGGHAIQARPASKNPCQNFIHPFLYTGDPRKRRIEK